MDTKQVWKNALLEGHKLLTAFIEDGSQLSKCEAFSVALTSTLKAGGNVFICGNGGSHCDAQHFAEEFTGRYRKDRRPLGVLALGEASHVTCVANDMGIEHIFSRQLEGLGRKGDMLIALTTSGKSRNIQNAIDTAKAKGMKTVALLGRDGGFTKGTTDLEITIPGTTSDRIQEMHMILLHTVIETVERELFPEHYC